MELTYQELCETSVPEPSNRNRWIALSKIPAYKIGTLSEIDEMTGWQETANEHGKIEPDPCALSAQMQAISFLRDRIKPMTKYIMGIPEGYLPCYTDAEIDQMWREYEVFFTIHYDGREKAQPRVELGVLDQQIAANDFRKLCPLVSQTASSNPAYRKYHGREPTRDIRRRLQYIVDRLFNGKSRKRVHYRKYHMLYGASLLLKWIPGNNWYMAIRTLSGPEYWGPLRWDKRPHQLMKETLKKL